MEPGSSDHCIVVLIGKVSNPSMASDIEPRKRSLWWVLQRFATRIPFFRKRIAQHLDDVPAATSAESWQSHLINVKMSAFNDANTLLPRKVDDDQTIRQLR